MNSIKNILVITESIDVNDSSGSKANVGLIQNLQLIGYQVTVFHYTQKEIDLNGVRCVLIPEKKWNVNFILSRIQRLFKRYTGIQLHHVLENWFGFSFTFFNDVSSIKKALFKETSLNPDLVITLSKGASFRPHYTLLGIPKWHCKWMAYVHDPYPFHYYPRPYNWVEPGFKQKESFFREVSEKAKYAAFPSLLLKEWMGSYFPNFLKTGVVIPHQQLEVEITKDKLPDYFDATKFTILHAGNLMKQRSPKGLIEGFKLFLSNYPEAVNDTKLLLIGSANYHHEMLASYQKEIDNLRVHPTNELFEVVYELQKQASINVIIESKSEISPFLPGKFPHCIVGNKPILLLAPYYSETGRLLGEEYPYISEVDDTVVIASLLVVLYKQWKLNPNELKLNRPDLEKYISKEYLKEVIEFII